MREGLVGLLIGIYIVVVVLFGVARLLRLLINRRAISHKQEIIAVAAAVIVGGALGIYLFVPTLLTGEDGFLQVSGVIAVTVLSASLFTYVYTWSLLTVVWKIRPPKKSAYDVQSKPGLLSFLTALVFIISAFLLVGALLTTSTPLKSNTNVDAPPSELPSAIKEQVSETP